MERLNDKIFRISQLIFREMTGTIDEAGRDELETWRKEEKENEMLYQQLYDKQRLKEEMAGMEEVDVLHPLEDMHLKIAAGRRRRIVRFFRNAVAAAAVLLVFAGCLYLFSRERRTEEIAIVQEKIAAGSARAILHLGNGKKVDLDTLDRMMEQGRVTLLKTEERKLAYALQAAEEKSNRETVYNEVEVPRGGEFDIVLADGTTVWLNAESRLRYPVEFTGDERRVYLEGEAYFQVRRNEKMPFRVEVCNQTVEVLGTEFNISGYRDEDNVYTTLVSGSVKVMTAVDALKLIPGEQSRVDSRSGKMIKQKVDVEKVVSWKKGMFILEEQTLEQIMQKFERWYDVSVFYQNQQLKQIVFKGVVPRYAELQDVLHILEKTNEVKFNIQKRTVIVSR